MKKTLLALSLISMSFIALANTTVNIDNFVQAETTNYFNKIQDQAPVNTFLHQGTMATVEMQNVIRQNQDTMYSFAVVDVSEGATFTLPERDIYQSIHIIDINHMMPSVIYSGESITITPDDVTAGEHVYVIVRTATKDYTEAGLNETRQAAEAVEIRANSAKPFEGVDYNQESLTELRDKLIDDMNNGLLTAPTYVVGRNFDEVHLESYRIAAAAGWGALPAKHAMYTPLVPGQGSSECSTYTLPKPDLDFDNGGFFSLTTYDNKGWIVKDHYALNNNQASTNEDGSITLHFNCEGQPNNIDVVEDWTGIIRLSKPNSVQAITHYVSDLLTETRVETL